MVLASTRLLFLEEEILLGGQAVLEGVMMRSPRSMAVAVRRPSGEIEVLRKQIPILGERYPVLKWPVLRGAVVMIQALVLGISSLNFSAEAAFEDLAKDDASGKGPKGPEALAAGATSTDSLSSSAVVGSAPAAVLEATAAKPRRRPARPRRWRSRVSVITSLVVGMGIFFLLPLAMTDLVKRFVPALQHGVVYNLVDGGFRIAVFLLYLFGISMLRDIKRVFEYHGAEHKTVYAHEGRMELTVQNVKLQSRLHPRCGTSFLLFVMVVSILVFSVLPTRLPFYVMIFPRLAMVPLVAGCRTRRSAGAPSARTPSPPPDPPGLWLQRLTTREPDDAQIAVAIRALSEALEMERRGGLPAVPA
jgi:uncharacterized protein YqhQ